MPFDPAGGLRQPASARGHGSGESGGQLGSGTSQTHCADRRGCDGGCFYILDNPIFIGLTVSLIFGLFVSTVLTLAVIPVVYYAAMRNRIRAMYL
ncbi:hypothetical protein A3197_00125 [Candidatus Thiodiazotropha endoloripes]|nr:hypothetical protein A3197_00125 [Candidatus Thiodiazotropha endoloripes]